MREATRALNILGFIDIRVPEGMFVAQSPDNFYTRSMQLTSKYGYDNVEELTEARIAVECAIVRLAAQKAGEAEKQKLQEVMEKAARAAAGAHRFGRYVFFLYDQTGEEQYRTWIERNAEWLKNSPQSENGVFGCVEDSSRNISGSVMFAVYPFYMEYETRYHNKAEYAQIVRQLLTLAPSEQTDMEQE